MTTWSLNAAGLVTQVDHPGGATETFSYDAHANLARHVDTIGVTFEYTWDLWGLPVRIKGESGQTYELFYDSRNEVAEIVEENGRRTTFVTDAMRQIIEERTTEGAITTSRYVAGALVERIRPDGGRFRFGYDGLLRLRWIENPAGERYEREYDASGNIAWAKGAERQARAFEWIRLGPLARIIDAQRGSRRYALDVMGRPVEAEGLEVRERFTYAPQGTAVPADVPFALGRDGRPIANGRARLSWDSAGRLAARHADDPLQSWQYRYDENNQLIQAVRGDGLEIRYLYDPFGRRLAVGFNDGTSVWFGWDGNSIVEELPSSGAPVRRVFADDGFTPLLESGPDGAWQLVLTDAAAAPWLYAAPDLQCSTIEMSTWGEVASRTGQPGQLRFAGQRADELTGLHYNRHRYYAPDLHVFLTPDPLALLSTLQDVGYVPNPTIFIDPLGLLTIINGSPGDPVMKDTIRQMKAQYPDAKVIRSDKLGKSPSIWQRLSGTGKNANMIDANENHVFVTTHGAPGRAQWKGKKGGYATGDEIGMQLNKAGFKGKGVRVDTTICNGATPGENDAPSITQGIANQTGATVWGALADDPGAARRGTPMTKHPITFVKPRPWYNFWSPTAKQGDGSDFVIEDKEYITDKQGHLYYGTMSGTPNNPTVHGGKYVPTAPKR
ncbi:RHS repeat domain-containing protein [Sorangium sp. So ce128]|uniref:RHS repeat domain-containing protein n=1 Tax=Sorangium sp. So ce128 TaxID=3133281 RepID=UPI003F621DA7